jgi:hypothetical protein
VGAAGGLILTVVMGQASSWLAMAIAAGVGGVIVIALQRS